MLIIEYDPINGEVVPDGLVRDWADTLVKQYEEVITMTVVIGSVVMLDMTRVLIMRKKLDHKKVTYRFGHFDQTPDKYGSPRILPEGFGDIYNDILGELLWGLDD